MSHAERREDTDTGELFPGLAADPLGNHAGDHVAEVLVLEGLADVAAGFQVAHRRQHLLPCAVGGYPGPVMPRQSAVVGQQIDDSDPVGGDWIVQAEFRQVLAHRLEPIEPPLVSQHGKPRGREGLGDRAQEELRAGGDRQGRLHIALAECLHQDRFVMLHDRDGETGDPPLGHGSFDQRFEVSQHSRLRLRFSE